MKNRFLWLTTLILIVLTACGSNQDENVKEKVDTNEQEKEVINEENSGDKKKNEKEVTEVNIFKPDITTSFKTGIEEPKYAISDKDFAKYQGIMNYLNEHPQVEESVLLKQLENVYGESSEELLAFMDTHQMNAINRDQGIYANEVSFGEEDAKDHIKMFFNKNVKDEKLLKVDLDSIEIHVVDDQLVLKGLISYNSIEYEYLLVSEYTENYQEVNFIGIKIDEGRLNFD